MQSVFTTYELVPAAVVLKPLGTVLQRAFSAENLRKFLKAGLEATSLQRIRYRTANSLETTKVLPVRE